METPSNQQQDLEVKTISKNQLKKQKKREQWLASRPERRKAEKEKRKQRRKASAQERVEKGDDYVNPRRYNLMETSDNKFRVVIDLDFEDFMTENELSKSIQQVGRIYATNRHTDNPCQLYLSSLKGKVRERFSIINRGYENWDINCSEKDYLDLCLDLKTDQSLAKEKLIYLTGDSDEILPGVDEILNKYQEHVFIIGGIVDHNRHKNLCLNRANERGIKTARLPISDHIKLNQRHILTTLNVFEILLEVFDKHKTWSDAIKSKIPKRKVEDNH